MLTRTAQLGVRAARRLRRAGRDLQRSRRRARIEAILSQPGPPRTCDDDAIFDRLQSQYPPLNGYGYDPFDAWWRAARQARWAMLNAGIDRPGLRVLDAACGDGLVGHHLAGFGHDATLTDLEDWRDSRAGHLHFVPCDLCQPLPLEPDSFDLIICYNAFEHVPDPAAAIRQMLRVCKPGGHIYLDFGPLYASAWGMHTYRTVRMPYPQYLFSRPFLEQKLQTLGHIAWPAALGQSNSDGVPLNGWKVEQFEQLWRNCGAEIVTNVAHCQREHLPIVEQFPYAFAGRGLRYADLVTHQLSVTLRKPAPDDHAAPSPPGEPARQPAIV